MAPFREQSVQSYIRLLTNPTSSEFDANEDKPIFVINVDDVVEKYLKWKELVPRVQPYYAFKCNDSIGIVKVLAALGCGFDCASSYELSTVRSLGVKPDNVIFANPVKTNTMLRNAADLSVDMMTFDSESELVKIKQVYPNAKLLLRLKVDDTASKYQLGNKFGAKPDEAIRLLNVASSMNLNLVGIAFHVGSDCHKAGAFESALEFARVIFDFAKRLGFNMQILDIGGGFPGDINFNDPHDFFFEMIDSLNSALDHYFSPEEFSDLKIISEPGRYFVSSCATLITKVVGKRPAKFDENGNPVEMMYYLNDGLFGEFLNKIWEPEMIKLTPAIFIDEEVSRPIYKSIVWGPTCDSSDVVAENILLPEMQVGEFFITRNYGAYTACLTTPFNGMEKAIQKHFVSNKYKQLLSLLPGGLKLVSQLN